MKQSNSEFLLAVRDYSLLFISYVVAGLFVFYAIGTVIFFLAIIFSLFGSN